MSKNIILIGMPGAGKSTVGVILAKTLGKSFLDTDLLIQEKENDLLQNIINNKGIEGFLEIEEKILSTMNYKNTIIATGGSAIYSEKAMYKLKVDSFVIYLDLRLEEIILRLSNITTRGVVLDKGQTIKDIYFVRKPLYEKYADFTINCNGKSIEEVIYTIINQKNIK